MSDPIKPAPMVFKLIAGLAAYTEPGVDLHLLQCHRGLMPPDKCERCGPVFAARNAVAAGLGFDPAKVQWDKIGTAGEGQPAREVVS